MLFGEAAGLAELPAAFVVGAVEVVPAAVEVMPPEVDAPVVDAEAGKLVSGVGSGGNGLDNTLAINSLRPASD